MRCRPSLLCMCLLIVASSVVLPARGQSTDEPDLKKAIDTIIEQTNRLRKENGLAPVAANDKLNTTADYFAKFMAASGKYGHEADGHLPSERATKHGYQYALINENIAWQLNSE